MRHFVLCLAVVLIIGHPAPGQAGPGGPSAATQDEIRLNAIAEQILVQRGFEAKSAKFIGTLWKYWRYNLENGDVLVDQVLADVPARERTPSVIRFAHLVPGCLSDIEKMACDFRFAPRYGCRLDDAERRECRANQQFLNARFKAFVFSYKKQYQWDPLEFSDLISCRNDSGRGANEVVFDDVADAVVSKLQFDATDTLKTADSTGQYSPIPRAQHRWANATCKSISDELEDNNTFKKREAELAPLERKFRRKQRFTFSELDFWLLSQESAVYKASELRDNVRSQIKENPRLETLPRLKAIYDVK